MDGLIGGGTEVMGRELLGTMADGKMVMRLFFTLSCFSGFYPRIWGVDTALVE